MKQQDKGKPERHKSWGGGVLRESHKETDRQIIVKRHRGIEEYIDGRYT